MNEPKEYAKLNKFESYDKEAAEELSEAIMEVKALTSRLATLRELIDDNKELQPFLWTTAEGVTKPLHQIDDDHLKNIMNHLIDNGRQISKPIKAEARKRKLAIPDDSTATVQRFLSAVSDVEDIDY